MSYDIHLAVQTALEDIKNEKPIYKDYKALEIVRGISLMYKVPVKEIIEGGRRGDIAEARQYSMFRIRKLLKYSQTKTGKLFGKDHTTCLHACRVIQNRIELKQLLIN